MSFFSSNESTPPANDAPQSPPVPPKRSPGHRGQDVRDTVAELAARAHEISLEAGSKMASALKDVINAAAGVTAFAVESARDLVQYFVRRGQMTQDEADRLLREAEDASRKRGKVAPRVDGAKRPPAPPTPVKPAVVGPAVRALPPKPAPKPPPRPAAQAKPKAAAAPAKKVAAKKAAAPKSGKKPASKK